MGFPSGSDSKESACNAGDLGWEDTVEKWMATHSSILAWRIPWTEEPMRRRLRETVHTLHTQGQVTHSLPWPQMAATAETKVSHLLSAPSVQVLGWVLYTCHSFPALSLGSFHKGESWGLSRETVNGTSLCWCWLPYSSNGKESACNAREQGSIPGSGRSSGEGNGNPL